MRGTNNGDYRGADTEAGAQLKIASAGQLFKVILMNEMDLLSSIIASGSDSVQNLIQECSISPLYRVYHCET